MITNVEAYALYCSFHGVSVCLTAEREGRVQYFVLNHETYTLLARFLPKAHTVNAQKTSE